MIFRYYVDQIAKLEPAKRQQLEARAVARTAKWIEVSAEGLESSSISSTAAVAPAPQSEREDAGCQPRAIPSRGLGDSIKKLADATGMSLLAKLYERTTGRPCGCGQRQQKLNQMFPYR